MAVQFVPRSLDLWLFDSRLQRLSRIPLRINNYIASVKASMEAHGLIPRLYLEQMNVALHGIEPSPLLSRGLNAPKLNERDSGERRTDAGTRGLRGPFRNVRRVDRFHG